MLSIVRIKIGVLSLLYILAINNKVYNNSFILRVVREVIGLSFIDKVNFVVINRAIVLLILVD